VKERLAVVAMFVTCLLTAGCAAAGSEGSGGGTQWGELELGGRMRQHDASCAGKHVEVEGTYNTVNLRGKCGRVLISGDHNTVNIQDAGAVVLTGRVNVVNLRSKVGVANRGFRNQINRPPVGDP
jgi:DUF3060 family protein